MMDRRVAVLRRSDAGMGAFGYNAAGMVWQVAFEAWASVSWVRGARGLREGAVDAYDSVMVRMRWRAGITRRDRLRIGGADYAIESLHADRGADTIQITAVEITAP